MAAPALLVIGTKPVWLVNIILFVLTLGFPNLGNVLEPESERTTLP